MPAINIPTWLDARIQPNKYARNGRVVSTSVEHYARRLANQFRAYEGRELFSVLAKLPGIGNGNSSPRDRWRFRSKTSALSSRVRVVMRLALQDAPHATAPDPRVVFELTDGTFATLGTITHHYGLGPAGGHVDGTLDEFAVVTGYVDVPGGTEVIGTFTEYDRANLISALVYDERPSPTKANGYVYPAATQGSNIYSADRQRLVAIVNSWPDVGSHVWNFNANDAGTPYTFVGGGGAPKNVVDQSSTTPSASTPGFFFDGTGKALRHQSGDVPVTIWVYGEASASNGGQVDVLDSGGSTVGSVTISNSLDWYSATFTLPDSSAKYDVVASGTFGTTVSVYAVSIYEDG
jgi:hypothetical protein